MSKALCAVENIYLDPEVEEELQNRLSRVEGHVRGIKRMLSEHASCEELLIQLSAVRAALRRAEEEILADHAAHCVANAIASGNKTEQRRKVAELIDVLSRSQR